MGRWLLDPPGVAHITQSRNASLIKQWEGVVSRYYPAVLSFKM